MEHRPSHLEADALTRWAFWSAPPCFLKHVSLAWNSPARLAMEPRDLLVPVYPRLELWVLVTMTGFIKVDSGKWTQILPLLGQVLIDWAISVPHRKHFAYVCIWVSYTRSLLFRAGNGLYSENIHSALKPGFSNHALCGASKQTLCCDNYCLGLSMWNLTGSQRALLILSYSRVSSPGG